MLFDKPSGQRTHTGGQQEARETLRTRFDANPDKIEQLLEVLLLSSYNRESRKG